MSRQRGFISRLGSLAASQVSRSESSLLQQGTTSYSQIIHGRLSGHPAAVDSWRGTRMGSARSFASGGGEEVVHEGLKLHATGGWHKAVGTTMASVMWFWVFYRLYHDYEGFLFGHAQHFEHELHDEGHNEH